ncbi:MAG: ABC transporter permease, partial [Firmicutes bacterium]|nr:ABC transporter permease [Bacillota bacterium]
FVPMGVQDFEDKAYPLVGAFVDMSHTWQQVSKGAKGWTDSFEGLPKLIATNTTNVMIDSNTTAEDLSVTPIFGRLPQQGTELAIPSALWEYIKAFGYFDKESGEQTQLVGETDAQKWEQVAQKEFGIYHNFWANKPDIADHPSAPVKLVGVVDTQIKVNDFYSEDGLPLEYAPEIGGSTYEYNLEKTQALMPILHSGVWESLRAAGIEQERFDDTRLNGVLVKSTHDNSTRKTIRSVNSKYEKRNINVVTARGKAVSNALLFSENAGKLFLYMGAIFIVMTMLLIANFVLASMAANRKMMGVFRSLGVGNKSIFTMYVSESGIIAGIISVLAFVGVVIVTPFLDKIFNTNLSLLFGVDILTPIFMIGVSLVSTAVMVALPIVKQIKKPIASIIKG